MRIIIAYMLYLDSIYSSDMNLFRPLIDTVSFVLCHLIIIPWLIGLTPAHKFFEPEYKVTADELNVRADSTLNGFVAGYLKKGTTVNVVHQGQNWHEIDLKKYHKTVTHEELEDYKTGKWFVSASHVIKAPKDVSGLYMEAIIIAHILCFLFLLVVKFKKFHRVIWYQVASINTIPSAIGLMLDMLMNLIFRPKTQTADVLE